MLPNITLNIIFQYTYARSQFTHEEARKLIRKNATAIK